MCLIGAKGQVHLHDIPFGVCGQVKSQPGNA